MGKRGKVEEGEQQVNKEEKGQGDGNKRKKERGLKSCPFLGVTVVLTRT